jgi:hypothetical protein
MTRETRFAFLVVALCGAVGIGVGAQSQTQFFDPADGTAPLNSVQLEAAGRALAGASLVEPVAPSTFPVSPQLLSGVGLRFTEIAPGVWFGSQGDKPAWEGTALVRRTSAGEYVSVSAPGPMSLAGFDGSNVLVHTESGVFSAPAADIASGRIVWTKTSEDAFDDFGLRGDYSTVDGPWPGDTPQETQFRTLHCIQKSCVVSFRGDGDGNGNRVWWTFDGGSTWEKDFDGCAFECTAGVGFNVAVATDSGLGRSWVSSNSTQLWQPDSVGALQTSSPVHWSSFRSRFVAIRVDGNVVAWSPPTQEEILATGVSGMTDALETPDGKLLVLRRVAGGFEVVRDGVTVFSGSWSEPSGPWFGPYAGGTFVTVARDPFWQAGTIASSPDGGTSWGAGPNETTEFAQPTVTSTTTTTTSTTTTTTAPLTVTTVSAQLYRPWTGLGLTAWLARS